LVSAWLWNFQTSGTSAMIPIQSSHVRGGTRISVRLFVVLAVVVMFVVSHEQK